MAQRNSDLPDRTKIRATFDREAGRYDRHAALEREVGTRLMERLVFQRRIPGRIIDLGSGTGYCLAALKKRFRKAEVIGLDASLAMSRAVRGRSGFLRPLRAVCGDLSYLPFADRSADLLFSNLALQWCGDFRTLGVGFRRILRPGGLLLFSTLGPDSLKEFKLTAAYGPDSGRVRHFMDMHDIGDALVAAGFSEPVMDSERITTEYRRFEDLVTELEASGGSTHFGEGARQTEPRDALAEAYGAYRRKGRYPVTWEIVYGAAFGPEEGQPIRTTQGDVAAFSVDLLRKSLPSR
jgi:malonyl-CoA O-methyltransferase